MTKKSDLNPKKLCSYYNLSCLGGGKRGGEQELAGGGEGERAAKQQAGGDSGSRSAGPSSPSCQVPTYPTRNQGY